MERDYEEDIRVAEPDYYGDEDFRGYREREVSTVRRRRANSELPEFREEIREEILEVKEEEPFPRRGKTKMPRRLVNKMAILELGYPFEEEVIASSLSLTITNTVIGRNHNYPQSTRQGAYR